MREVKGIAYAAHPECLLDLYLPTAEHFPVFIYFHGGGIEEGSRAGVECFIEELTKAGIAVVSADYRMYPTAKYPEFIEDSAAAVAWVKNNIGEYGVCDGIFVGGSSAGGDSAFSEIRRMINTGNIGRAEQMLYSTSESMRNAEWNFLMGCVKARRGNYVDAQRFFDIACSMDPYNNEYRTAQNELRNRASGYGGGYRTSNAGGCSGCDVCSGLLCADCCCECCGGDLISCC